MKLDTKITIKKILCGIAAFVAFILFSSCGASIEINAENGSATIAYRASFGRAFIDLMRALSDDTTSPLFDAQVIQAQFRASGIDNAIVASSSDESLSISTRLPYNSRNPLSQSGCLEKSAQGITLTFSPKTLQALYVSLPPLVQSYIDLCMSPVFIGEKMARADYIDMVASVYGQALADELDAAHVTITLRGESANAVKKTRTIPLVELLTLDEPLVLSSE